jgi:ribosomal peptide maturation radical SAM protein 1
VQGDDDSVLTTSGDAMITDLDGLPTPDYSDFYAQHAASVVASGFASPSALFETARGCWWGAKHHCTFCGINGNGMAFRAKSAQRAFDEIADLAARYGTDLVSVDTILATEYFTTLLPKLAMLPDKITAYCELKSNLRPAHFVALRDAGLLKIQPGIESMESGILRLMRKGVTAIQNVQTLKLGAEHDLFVEWNLLTGFPGETTEQYERMSALLPSLTHLQPPSQIGRVRADRFSPYHSTPERFGAAIRPYDAYRFVYPFDDATIASLAYHFIIDQDSPSASAAVIDRVERQCRAWQAGQPASMLRADEAGNDLIRVTDRRSGRPSADIVLRGAAADILRLCWTIQPLSRLAFALGLTELDTRDGVAVLVEHALVMIEGDQILSLPLTAHPDGRAPDWTEVRARSVLRAIASRQAAVGGTVAPVSAASSATSEARSNAAAIKARV